ncbi:hypothetical protein D3C75_904730 [compost metagenome]
MKLNGIESGFNRALYRLPEFVHHLLNLSRGQSPGCFRFLVIRDFGRRYRYGCIYSLSARMGNLDGNFGAILVAGIHNPFQGRDLLVRP